MPNDSEVRDFDQYLRTLEEAGRRADAETRQIVASQQAERAAKSARTRLPELPEDVTGAVRRARLLAIHKFESVPPYGDPNCIPSLRSAITEAARILLVEGYGAAYLEAFGGERVAGIVDDLACLARKDLRDAADDWLNRGILSLTPGRIEEALEIARIELQAGIRASLATVAVEQGSGDGHQSTVKKQDKQRELVSPKRPPAVTRSQLKIPPGTAWSDVTIRLLDGHKAQIFVAGQREAPVCGHFEMGFADRRGKSGGVKPIRAWAFLEVLARSGPNGIDAEKINPADRRTIEKRVQEIRKKLQVLLGLTEDPFGDFRREKRYRLKLKISSVP